MPSKRLPKRAKRVKPSDKRKAKSSTSRSRKSATARTKSQPVAARRAVLVCSVASAPECKECGQYPATVRVTSTGMATEPTVCTRCHEKLCAREWRGDVWLRQMK